MATQIKKSKPTSPGRRFRSWVSRDGLHKGDPYAPLLESKKQKSGRNNQGRITTRHQRWWTQATLQNNRFQEGQRRNTC